MKKEGFFSSSGSFQTACNSQYWARAEREAWSLPWVPLWVAQIKALRPSTGASKKHFTNELDKQRLDSTLAAKWQVNLLLPRSWLPVRVLEPVLWHVKGSPHLCWQHLTQVPVCVPVLPPLTWLSGTAPGKAEEGPELVGKSGMESMPYPDSHFSSKTVDRRYLCLSPGS